jgi:hypothetical protein
MNNNQKIALKVIARYKNGFFTYQTLELWGERL